MTDERSSSSILTKTISERQTGIELATFSWLLRYYNHWATNTQMVSFCGISSISFLTYNGFCSGSTCLERAPYITIWVLVPHWLERLAGHQKVAGSIPVWGSEIVFLRIELDDRSSIISRYLQALTLLKYKYHKYHY